MSPEVSMSFAEDGSPTLLPAVPAPPPPAPATGMPAVVVTPTVVEPPAPTEAPVRPYVDQVFVGDAPPRVPASGVPSVSAVSVVPAKRKKRGLRADNPWVLGLMLFLVTGIAAASFYVSFSGLYAAAEWAVGPVPALQFAVPFMLDVAIIAYTMALFVERERGKSVRGTWWAIGLFAAVSSFANVLHTLVVTTAENPFQLMVGVIISGGAPLLLAFSTDKIAVTVFEQSEEGSLVRSLVLGEPRVDSDSEVA